MSKMLNGSLIGLSSWSAVSASFIPPAPIRELRDLTRYRKTLVQERAQEVNRIRDPCWRWLT